MERIAVIAHLTVSVLRIHSVKTGPARPLIHVVMVNVRQIRAKTVQHVSLTVHARQRNYVCKGIAYHFHSAVMENAIKTKKKTVIPVLRTVAVHKTRFVQVPGYVVHQPVMTINVVMMVVAGHVGSVLQTRIARTANASRYLNVGTGFARQVKIAVIVQRTVHARRMKAVLTGNACPNVCRIV